jgi:hypothetical protein
MSGAMLARILAVVALAWILLLPPLFTHGACTAEFDREAARIEADRAALRTPELAAAYFRARGAPYSVYSLQQCRRARPRSVANCGDGPLVLARPAISGLVCRIYRDDEVRVHLHYDDRDRLARVVLDMNPYKSLPLPGFMLHWAR